MAETDTSPAALRALAERLSDEDEYLDCLHQYDSATLCRKAAAVLAALAAEKEAGAPAPDAEGWIPWFGGECPVPDGTLVDVKLGDDVVDGPAAAEEWDWFHRVAGQGGDIIAYRLSKEG